MRLINYTLMAVLPALWLNAAVALETDRQKPLEVNADSTDGLLGDGITKLKGSVEIRQGTLLITADSADIEKSGGKVRQINLRGKGASLQQEIEQQGMVRAWANRIEYQVGSGMVLLSGNARVNHPQYEVSGEELRYDLNAQHFEGHGGENGSGRVHIRLDPELAPEGVTPESKALPEPTEADTEPATPEDPGTAD